MFKVYEHLCSKYQSNVYFFKALEVMAVNEAKKKPSMKALLPSMNSKQK